MRPRKSWSLATALVLLIGACGDSENAAETEAQVLAAALHHLATEGNTFGPEHRFSELAVWENLDPGAGASGAWAQTPGPLMTDLDRDAIERRLMDLGPVRWIDDPREWITDDLRPVVAGAAILSVGAVIRDGDEVLVAVHLWCGGVCGFGTTYRLARVGDGWAVVGHEGGMFIS